MISKHICKRFRWIKSLLFAELQAGRIYAIPHPCFVSWPVIKDMPEMAIATSTANFRPDHAVRFVHNLPNIRIFKLIEKGRPAASAIEFRLRREQRFLADQTFIGSVFKKLIKDI